MVTSVKYLIIQQIKAVFGNTFKIYDEPVRQGLKVPAFQLLIVDNTQKTGLNVVHRTYTINVNYFPLSLDERRSECDGVLETFQTAFRLIGNKYHTHEIAGSMSDDVMVITFNLKLLLKDIYLIDKMETLKLEVH